MQKLPVDRDFVITQEQELESVVQYISPLMCQKKVFFLYGDLGTGKTTLCRYILSHFGYKGWVKSPTYDLMQIYSTEKLQFCHLDLYRLQHGHQLEDLGLRDIWDDHVMLIEWPERAEQVLPPADVQIHLRMQKDTRLVSVQC